VHNVTCMDQKLLRECIMLQSEVQAVTITKTIRKGKRLLAPLMKSFRNNASRQGKQIHQIQQIQ